MRVENRSERNAIGAEGDIRPSTALMDRREGWVAQGRGSRESDDEIESVSQKCEGKKRRAKVQECKKEERKTNVGE
jgi:hypothetical protein